MMSVLRSINADASGSFDIIQLFTCVFTKLQYSPAGVNKNELANYKQRKISLPHKCIYRNSLIRLAQHVKF